MAARSRRLVVPAPAKLNLFLHVTGRRADGYHELQTVFQFVDLADEITLELREDGAIAPLCATPGVPAARDLALRAARLLQAESGSARGAGVGVRKHIPAGAGLGGGSSDAASTLVGLARLWGLGATRAELAALGLRLGADVPVFVHGHAAWAEGVGERLTPVALEEPWYLLVNPGCPVATAEVFAAPALTRNTPLMTISDFVSEASAGAAPRLSLRRLLEGAGNDCEPVVRERFAEVDGVLRWLSAFGPARMTGSGACVFAPCAGEREARRLLQELPGRWQGWVVRGRNRSPLADS